MVSSPHDFSKDTFRRKLWEARNQEYIQNLVMQKKHAFAQSQKAAEQEQKLKLKLARRVLGASFERLYPRHAAALDRPLEAGVSVGASDGESAGASAIPAVHSASVTGLERADSHSRIPKLPPLADTTEAPANINSHTAASLAAGVGRLGDEPGLQGAPNSGDLPFSSAIGASWAASGGAVHDHTPRHLNGRGSNGSKRAQHPLSRSASAGPPGTSSHRSKQSSTSCDGDGGPNVRNPKQLHPYASTRQQQQPYQHRDMPTISQRHRTTLSEPPMQRVQEEREYGDDETSSSSSASSGEDGEGAAEGQTVRRGKSTRGGGDASVAAVAGQSTPRKRSSALSAGPSATAARSFSRRVALAGLPPTPAGYAQWRARAQLAEGQRTFCISGTGNHSQGIRAGLLARGWYENPDRNSPFFDFKWSANPLDINHEALWPGQIVNHFRHSTCLTTKHGLCHTVRDMVWYEAADSAAFYPRAYDISEEASRRQFLQDVRWTAAESLMKRALIDGAVCSSYVPYTPGKKSRTNNGTSMSSQQESSSFPPVLAQQAQQQAQQGATPATGSVVLSFCGADSGGQAQASGNDGEGEGAELAEGAGQRLQQPTDSNPLVDLPSLRLACRVVAARLRQQRHLRVAHESSGGCSGARGGGIGRREAEPAPTDLQLTPAQWQQLVRHRALFCSAPVIPAPQFDPSWITHRQFITSAKLPGAASSRGNGRGGRSLRRRGRKSPPRSSRSPGPGRQRRQRGGGGGNASGGTVTDGEAEMGGSASDSDDGSGSSDEDGGAGHGTASDVEGDAKPAPSGGAKVVAAPQPRASATVAVVDAAELLREVYGKARRRHSAPPMQQDAAAVSEGEAEPLAPCASSLSASAPPSTAPAPGSGADAAVDDGDDDATSWLPQDLPPICYDDVALQALDHTTWRDAAAAILAALESSAVQTHISGTNNIWIVKPAGKSRGRGIRLFNDPDTLMSYVRCEEAQGLESRWIAQKYVERPLIIAGRKFDIRQWVLVTDWNPLQAWFYSTCYLRFAADDYDPNNLDIFQHLTNNSVSKYYEGPKKEDEITASGNMWSIPRFQRWLSEVYGRDDIWQVLLQPAMRHIAICTLKSAQDLITPRKSSCQLYGYDFLIDDQLRVWLLEVNSSPTLEASTAITAELCADVQEDILKVVVDLPEKQAAAAAAVRCRISSPRSDSGPATEAATADGGGDGDECEDVSLTDTGKWELMIDGGEELRQPQYTGLNLELKGIGIHFSPPRSNFVGRLHAATRSQYQSQPQQQQPQQQPHRSRSPQHQAPQPSHGLQHLAQEESGSDGLGGDGSGDASHGQRLPMSVVGPASNPTTGVFGLLPVSRSPLSSNAAMQHQQPVGGHTGHGQQPLYPGGTDNDPSGAGVAVGGMTPSPAGSAATAAMALRIYSAISSPPSRGGCRTPLVRSRTPRLSATPQMLASWDAASAAATAASSPPAVTVVPNGATCSETPNSGAAAGSSGCSPVSKVTTPRGELPAAAALVFMSSPPSHPDPLSPLTMRMSLLARPGHGGPAGLGGVRAR